MINIKELLMDHVDITDEMLMKQGNTGKMKTCLMAASVERYQKRKLFLTQCQTYRHRSSHIYNYVSCENEKKNNNKTKKIYLSQSIRV